MLPNRVIVLLWKGGRWSVNASRLRFPKLCSFPSPLCKTPSSVSRPINTILLVYILHLIQRIIISSTSILHNSILRPTEFKAGYSRTPRCPHASAHAFVTLLMTYTPRTPAKCNKGNISLTIAGTVFDVTAPVSTPQFPTAKVTDSLSSMGILRAANRSSDLSRAYY